VTVVAHCRRDSVNDDVTEEHKTVQNCHHPLSKYDMMKYTNSIHCKEVKWFEDPDKPTEQHKVVDGTKYFDGVRN